MTVLFLPITQSLLSMLQCQYSNGVYVHSIYPQIICWQGSHIVHGSLCVVMSVVFIIVCIVVSLTYFESRMLTEDPTARYYYDQSMILIFLRQHSHGDVVFLINKIVLQLAFAFLPNFFNGVSFKTFGR